MHERVNEFQRIFFLTVYTLITILGFGVVCAAMAGNTTMNPAYSHYDFGDRKKVIVLASQPLGILHSVLPEVMRRDRILKRILQSNQLELRIFPFFNGPDINHYMRQGNIDMAMAGDFPTLSIASTTNVQVIAFVKRDKASIVSHNKYSTLHELVGKRVASPAGTSSHLGLLVVLEAAGLQETDVKMVPMDISLLTSALVKRDIDAFAGWEPIPTAAISENRELKIISQFLNTDFFYWTGDFARQKPEISLHFLTAYVRAINWLNENDGNLTLGAKWSISGTTSFLGKKSTLSFPQFKRQIRQNLKLIGSGAIPPDEFTKGSYLNRAFNLLKKKNLLPIDSQWKKVENSLKSSLVNEVLTNPRKYKVKEFDYQAE